MRKIALRIFLFSCTVTVATRCGGDAYRNVSRTCDSLAAVLNVCYHDLNLPDTLAIAGSVNTFNTYTVFIRDNVKDTLDVSSSAALRNYFAAAAAARGLMHRRVELRSNISLAISQLQDLSDDAVSRRMRPGPMLRYLITERAAAIAFADSARMLQRRLESTAGALAGIQPAVEAIIRKNNSGELPLLVKTD